MSNVAEELKKILTIEETIFTIDRVVSEIVNITNSLPSATSKQPPLKPSPPIKTASMCIQTIPAYDEKAYLVKAKKEEHAGHKKQGYRNRDYSS